MVRIKENYTLVIEAGWFVIIVISSDFSHPLLTPYLRASENFEIEFSQRNRPFFENEKESVKKGARTVEFLSEPIHLFHKIDRIKDGMHQFPLRR